MNFPVKYSYYITDRIFGDNPTGIKRETEELL